MNYDLSLPPAIWSFSLDNESLSHFIANLFCKILCLKSAYLILDAYHNRQIEKVEQRVEKLVSNPRHRCFLHRFRISF